MHLWNSISCAVRKRSMASIFPCGCWTSICHRHFLYLNSFCNFDLFFKNCNFYCNLSFGNRSEKLINHTKHISKIALRGNTEGWDWEDFTHRQLANFAHWSEASMAGCPRNRTYICFCEIFTRDTYLYCIKFCLPLFYFLWFFFTSY